MEDAKEVGLTDSTQSVGKPHTKGEAVSNIATGIGIVIPIQQRLEEYARKTKPDSDKSKARQAIKIYIANAFD